jgi:pimeloyl-ACP methyl ester carboxylesterase
VCLGCCVRRLGYRVEWVVGSGMALAARLAPSDMALAARLAPSGHVCHHSWSLCSLSRRRLPGSRLLAAASSIYLVPDHAARGSVPNAPVQVCNPLAAVVRTFGTIARLIWLEITWARIWYLCMVVVHIIKRSLEAVLLVAILLASASITYQNYTQMMDSKGMPGQHLARNSWGDSSHMVCKGVPPSDSRHPRPVVILEAMEMLGQALVWTQLQERLGTLGIVCSYDRAGFGWSAWGTSNRSPKLVAAELAYMLVKGSNGAPPSVDIKGNRVPIRPPFVLAGHSAGSLYTRQFAMDYPHLTAAIVAFDGLPAFGAGPAGAEAYTSDLQQYFTRDLLWAANSFLQPLGVLHALFPLVQVRFCILSCSCALVSGGAGAHACACTSRSSALASLQARSPPPHLALARLPAARSVSCKPRVARRTHITRPIDMYLMTSCPRTLPAPLPSSNATAACCLHHIRCGTCHPSTLRPLVTQRWWKGCSAWARRRRGTKSCGGCRRHVALRASPCLALPCSPTTCMPRMPWQARHLPSATCCFSSEERVRARHARGCAFLAMSADSDRGETRQPNKADREYALQGLQGLERAGAHQVPMVVWARARTCKRALPLVQGNPGCGETWDSASGNGTFALHGRPVSWYHLQLQLARCTQWQPPQVRSRLAAFPPPRQLSTLHPPLAVPLATLSRLVS